MANLSYVLVGAIATILVTIVWERRKCNIRRQQVARITAGDVEGQLQVARMIRDTCVPSLKKSKNLAEGRDQLSSFAGLLHFHNDSIFVSLLLDIGLLPTECVRWITDYYRTGGPICRHYALLIEEEDPVGISGTTPYLNLVLLMGNGALLCLYENVLKTASDAERIRKTA